MIRRPSLRSGLLAGAALAALAASLPPSWPAQSEVYDLMLVVDITGSMMARDYSLDGAPASRLDKLRLALPRLLERLPCESRVGLSIFSERRSFVLFDPVEICENFDPVTRAIQALDWRMAWEGDSYVLRGLITAMETARGRDYGLLFLTDGQQAPPLSEAQMHLREAPPEGVAGMVIGVGGDTPVPIPKFDDLGNETGFYQPAEVPQAATGWTAPIGGSAGSVSAAPGDPNRDPRRGRPGRPQAGTEHLTRVRHGALRAHAETLGLGYAHLAPDADLARIVTGHFEGRAVVVTHNVAPWFGWACLALMALAHGQRFVTPFFKPFFTPFFKPFFKTFYTPFFKTRRRSPAPPTGKIGNV